MSVSKIPFLDLITVHRELQEELTLVFRRALDTAAFVGGAAVESFEERFAQFCEVQYCVGVGSGTDALRFALLAAGIGKDEVVITVPNTFIATAEAISQVGAMPQFVDVNERTYNMDPEKLGEFLEACCTLDAVKGKLISNSTGRPVTAIVPVHLYGQMADMDPIQELADRYHLVVVEDACQAHGAQYFSKKENRWRKAGSIGVAAAFSFYPGKNLGACGEAGAITTNDAKIAQKSRMLRDHGQAEKYHHDMEGYNGRLDAIQAGILTVKLQSLAQWNEQRCIAAARYDQFFVGVEGIMTPFVPSYSKPVYHLYILRVSDRRRLQEHLTQEGIDTGIHYPIPLHQQRAYIHLGYKAGDFPTAERAASQIISLPMFPTLTSEQQSRVAGSVLKSISAEVHCQLEPCQ
jgi:dTDP-4-amino-4,6-dideoxygalactose transaminase